MAKIILDDLASLENQTSFLQVLNANFARLAAALENTVSRDGTAPNQMGASLDLNSQRIINLPAPQAGSDAARLSDIQNAVELEGVVLPELDPGKVLSNDGETLLWMDQEPGALVATNNLSDVPDKGVARTNLGLGSAATYAVGVTGAVVPLLTGGNHWLQQQNFDAQAVFNSSINVTNGPFTLNYNPTALNDTEVGFRSAPQATQNATYTLALANSGGSLVHTSGSAHTWTIPPHSSAAYPVGSVIVLRNSGTGVVTIARGAGVALRKAGSGTDANASIAQWGFATLYKEGTNAWVISGTGVS